MRRGKYLDAALGCFVAAAWLAVFTTGMHSRSFHGVISDSICASETSPGETCNAERIRADVATGAAWVLVDDDGPHVLSGSKDRLAAFAGREVSVIGTVEGEQIRLSSIYQPRNPAPILGGRTSKTAPLHVAVR